MPALLSGLCLHCESIIVFISQGADHYNLCWNCGHDPIQSRKYCRCNMCFSDKPKSKTATMPAWMGKKKNENKLSLPVVG